MARKPSRFGHYARTGLAIGRGAYDILQRWRATQAEVTRAASRLKTLNKRRQKNSMPASKRGVLFSRSKKTIGRKRKRSGNQAFRSMLRGYREVVNRFQSISENLLGPGRLPLQFGNGSVPDNPTVYNQIPIYFMSLTNRLNETSSPAFENTNAGAYNTGLCRLFMNSQNNAVQWSPLNCSKANGSSYIDPVLTREKGPVLSDLQRTFHNWTSIKLALYGSKSYPITYDIYVMKMPRRFNPHIVPAQTDLPAQSEVGRWMQDWVRILTNHPMSTNGNVSDFRKWVKTIYHKRVVVNPLTYADAAAETSDVDVSVGNVRMHNMFLRHDRFRDYEWYKLPSSVNGPSPNNPGLNQFDVEQGSPAQGIGDVAWEKRLMFFVTAKCPEFAPNASWFRPDEPNPILPPNTLPTFGGSLDINVRQSFRMENGEEYSSR